MSDCLFCGRPGVTGYCTTAPAPGAPPCQDCATQACQLTFVDGLLHLAAAGLGPMPTDLPQLDPPPARLEGVLFGLLPALAGGGPLPPYRLSPQGNPDVDLVAYDTDGQWPDSTSGVVHLLTLLTDLVALLHTAQKLTGTPHDLVGGLLRSVCQLLESRYELCPLLVDEHGDVVGEAPDIAPGLAAAFTAAWPPHPAPAPVAAVPLPAGRPVWLPGQSIHPC